jgi:hypothetical protein
MSIGPSALLAESGGVGKFMMRRALASVEEFAGVTALGRCGMHPKALEVDGDCAERSWPWT